MEDSETDLLTDTQLAEIERVMAPPLQKLLGHVRAQAEQIRVMTARALGHAYVAQMAEGGEAITEQENARLRREADESMVAARTPLDSLDELTRLILGNGPLSLSAAKERVLDMMNVIAACDDAFSNAQLDEDHVEHIIHSHSDSIFDYYRVLAKDLRPADRALADYNNKRCDEMEARAAAKGGPRGIDG